MTEQRPSKELVSRLREQSTYLFPKAADTLMVEAAAEIERLRTALTGISTCSTCEACRGAAMLALGGAQPPPDAHSTEYKIGDKVNHCGHLTEVIGLSVKYMLCGGAVVYGHDLRPAQPPEGGQ